MAPTISTWRPWYRRAMDALQDLHRRYSEDAALHRLDPRTLADIGVDASELASIEAESRAQAPLTRLRIVWAAHRG